MYMQLTLLITRYVMPCFHIFGDWKAYDIDHILNSRKDTPCLGHIDKYMIINFKKKWPCVTLFFITKYFLEPWMYFILPLAIISADGYCHHSLCPPTHPSVLLSVHLTWNLVAWCYALWSGSLFETATLRQCLHFLISASRGCCCSLNFLQEIF